MPFELLDTLKNTYGMTFASRGLNSIFCNKIYTTIILTIIIIILIIIIYPCKKGTQFWVVGKLGIYIFISILVILFIHSGVVYSSYTKENSQNDDEAFVESSFDGSDDIVFNKDNIQVTPGINTNSNKKPNNEATVGGSESIFEMYGV